jgi:hypothetical protein
LVIAPSQGVHTFGMHFPIDVIGVARDGRIVKIKSSVCPRRVVLSFRAFAMVELGAGATASARIRLGDLVVLARVSA